MVFLRNGLIKFIFKLCHFLIIFTGGKITMKRTFNIEIQVQGNLEKSLKQLKKKIEREGVVRDMKRQVYFEPTTQKKRKRLMRAIKNSFLKNAENKSL